MNDSKHTPGPWRISRTSGMEIFINHGHDQPNRVAGYFAEVRRFTSDNEQVEANARLIAAAPDLLYLLKEARSTLEMWKDVAPAVSLCADIDKAIAKATGAQP